MPSHRIVAGGFMKPSVFGTRALTSFFVAAFMVWAASSSANAQARSERYTPPLITQGIDESQLVTLPGNTRPDTKSASDLGRVPDNFQLDHLLLQLKRSPEQEQALQQFITELHDEKSTNFHQWITPLEFGQRFGLAQQDLDTVSRWLESHGLTVNVIYPSGTLIDFSGTAGQVRQAFRTEIHAIESNGEKHISNMGDPRIPLALVPAIHGLVSLNDFRPRALHKLRKAHTDFTVNDSSGTSYAVVPGDLATIYNLNPLFTAGYSGQGQTIVLIEDTDVFNPADWNSFRSTFGLTSYASASFSSVHPAPLSGANNCAAPGVVAPNDAEAILDAEWASAAAPSAAIEMASCADTATTFGGLIAIQNLINANDQPPAIMSVSYGQCETVNGAAANAAYNATYQQAVAEGVSVFVAAGDSGAAGCDNSAAQATNGIAVNAFASTPYNVAVGGTDFSDTYSGANDTYWNTTNASTFASALSYVPEIPWNDSCAGVLLSTYEGYSPTYGPTSLCNDPFYGSFLQTTVAGGGGPSACATGAPSSGDVVSGTCQGWPKPAWQSIFGNPNDGVRDTPDVSLFAADGLWGHYYIFCWSDTANGGAACSGDPSTWTGAGGTSFASPILSGIQALINQRTGTRQGNPAPVYYQLAANQYGPAGGTACNSSNGNQTSPGCVFYDVTLGDMDVDCSGSANCYQGVLSTSNTAYMPAYPAAAGWDFATGIGTINATNLVNNWPPAVPGFSLSASPTSLSVQQGSSVSSTITISPQTGFAGTVTLSASGLPSGITASFSPVGATSQSVLTLSSTSTTTTGTFNITITGVSGSVAGDTTIRLTVTAQTWTISGTIANGGGVKVVLGGAASSTVTADPFGNYSFSGLANGTYTVTPSSAGYIFSPFNQSVTLNGGNVSSVNFTAIVVLAQSGWTLKYVDSQEVSCSNTGAVLSFDGNPATMWHTQWCTASPEPPHEIQINLGTIYNLTGFAYLPRQDSSDNGKIKQYEFYVSNDATNWSLVSSGVLMTTPGDKGQKVAMFNAVQGQFVRLREITEINGNPWASMAEINVLGTNLPPDFIVSSNPAAASVPDGGFGTVNIATQSVGSFNNAIGLSATGQPAGVTVTFNPATLASAGSASAMTIGVGSGVSVGTYPITVTASGGGSTHSTTVTLTVLPPFIPQSGWTLKYVDSQEVSCSNTGAVLSFDGNPATMWHTQWCTASPGPPHEIQINLGTIYNLTGFAYLPRQDGPDNGKIKQYEFYVSNDATNWSLVSSGVLMTTPGDKSQKVVMFNAVQGQFVRLREITEINGNPWASMAELNILGGSLPPDFVMSVNPNPVSLPEKGSGNISVTTVGIGGFNNAIGLSATGQPAGVTVAFNPATLTSAGSASVMTIGVGSGVSVGTYPITVTGSGGGITHSVTVPLTVLPPFIPQSGWTLKYVDSQEVSCSNTGAVMSFDGNPATMWHTQWCTASPGPPHEIQINLGTIYNLTGFAYLPRQDSSDNGKMKQYEFYVSNDATNWSLVSSGVLMTTPGDKSQKVVMFNAVQGQFVRLREITEINGNPWASMAEINVF